MKKATSFQRAEGHQCSGFIALKNVVKLGITVCLILFASPALAQTETILEAPESAEIESWFGLAVGISDEAAVVGAGAEDGEGAAYIYEKSGGVWTMMQRIQPVDIARGDDFGGKLSMSGTRAVIGARYKDSNSGAAYVYDRMADGTWIEAAKLLPDDLETGDNFGEFTSVDGDRAAVGSRREDTGGNDAGAAYIFDLVGETWTQVAKLQSSDIAAGDRFGQTVSVSGDRVMAGGGNAAYIFDLENGSWTQTAKLEPSQSDTQFGLTVDVEGDRALISGQGVAYVFELINDVWTETAQLTPTSDENPQVFGRRVSLSGDKALVSAHLAGSAELNSAGSAFLFEIQDGIWSQTHEIVASDRKEFDKFGSAISVFGDNVISGAPGLSFTATEQSSAYIYEFSNAPTASFTFVENDLMIDFDGSGSSGDGTIVSWDWDFGDGNTGSGTLASHTYTAAGTYTVGLTVTDDAGATGSTTQTIDVGNPPPTASFVATQTGGTLDVDFDGSASTDDGSITNWDWDFGDGNTGTGETVMHTFAATGTYTVTLTVTDDEGATGEIMQDVDVINADPVASFSATQTAGTLDVSFDGAGSTDDGTITSWDWDFGDGNVGSGETASHTYAAAATYSVMLTVTDNLGATGVVSMDVDVLENIAPVASFTFTVNDLMVDFDGSGSTDDGAIVSWDWDFGDGNTDAGETISHTYAAAGTYTVALTVTDDEGATGSSSQSVTVTEGTTGGTLHVESITTLTIKTGGAMGFVQATVLILDENGVPVEDATVSGTFSDDVSGADTQLTDAGGEALLDSDNITGRPQAIGICIDDVTHGTLTYDPGANSDPDFACSGAAPSRAHNSLDSLSPLADLPESFDLKANFPNPFNPTTTIAFDLPEAADVRLEVYDMMGRRIATLVNGQMGAGRYEAIWNATSDSGASLASGVYLYKLQAGSFESVKRMVLMK